MSLWPQCLDDRGQPRAFNDRMLRPAARAAGIDARGYAAGAKPLRGANGARLLAVLLIGLAIVALPLVLRAFVPLVPMLVADALLAIVVVVWARALLDARLYRAQRRAALSLGLCPACGYPITAVPPQDDNCRVCPECGSAWKLDAGAPAARP